MDAKDEIKARLPIEQLVAQYCQLKRKGRSFVALCPFHNDSKPSLLVSPDKGIAYCFACQSGGDIFSFVQKIENVDFPEALKILAEKAGVVLPKAGTHHKPSVTKDEKERLRECLEAAQKFFMERLKATPAASEYVKNRGVPPELAQQFGIGYAPDSYSATYDHLLKSGFSRTEIIAAGMGIQRELEEGKIYDRFRHRIMFPITDPQGTVIGFGGRAMGDSDAKYVNSPESPLYNKSSVLFGLFHARDAVRSSRKIVLVEGYFDAIAAHKAGVKNVVAVSGTALTEEHVKIIKRYADDVILCLDQDNAGQLAAGRAFDLLSRANLAILSVTLPSKDPDELVQRDAPMFKHIIDVSAIPYIEAIIDRLSKQKDIAEPAGKRVVAETLFPLIAALGSSVEVRAYIEKAAQKFGIVSTEMHNDFAAFRKAETPRSVAPKKAALTESAFLQPELCIGIALIYPAVRPLLAELIPIEEPGLEAARITISKTAADIPILDALQSLDIDPLVRERMQVVALFCEENFPLWSETVAAKELKKLCMSANRELTLKKQMEIVKQLKDARAAGRADEESKLLTQYQQLLKLNKMASPL
jgi:DNA primase